MKYKNSFICFYIISLIIFIKVKICKCQYNNNYENEKFLLKLYDLDDSLITELNLHYSYTSYLFNEYYYLYQLSNIKYAIICSEEDNDLDESEIETFVFWNVASYSIFLSSSIFLNVFPLWYNEQKKNNKHFCMRIDSVGWYDNAYASICDDEHKYPCPDLIILGVTQLTHRYYNDEIIDLNKYFRNYFKKNGRPLESLLNKYSFYDYNIDNNWLAVPVMLDFRVLKFNITTFDYCISQGYNLKYPPPINDNWGKNYRDTWNWEKVFEYAKMITECTKNPGFKLLTNYYEDMNFFINICQTLNIPFFTENSELNTKKCGLRNPEYIMKLSTLRSVFENHYIENWFNETIIETWLNSDYPKSIDNLPKIEYNDTLIFDESLINGLYYTNLFSMNEYPDIKLSYYPGTSTIFGSGFVITKKSKYPDQAFEFIEIFIDEKYPFFTEANISVTPFDDRNGKQCQLNKINKKTKCNSLLELDGIYPYYYNINNITEIVYLKHISSKSDRGISIINNNTLYPLKSKIFHNIQNINFTCDNEVSYEKKTITYKDEYRIEIPINSKENLLLKSMTDVIYINQADKTKCEIYDETSKYAKPLPFPYTNFMEFKNLELRSPVSLLFSHLYYNYYKTYKKEEATFEDLIDEFCDIVDDSLIPYCKDTKILHYSLTECNIRTLKMNINYLNCKTEKNDGIPRLITCPYLPNKNYLGFTIRLFGIIFLIIEVLLLLFPIIYRKERCIYIAGINFLIITIIFCILINMSIFYWIGEFKTHKCILKVWTMILGITGYISSYSVKSKIIISVYNNKKLKSNSNKQSIFITYGIVFLIQIILLTIWTLTHKGVQKENVYYQIIGYIELNKCSTGNKRIFYLIFIIDYILLAISIVISYQGRKIPDEFNDVRKIYISSLISIFQLTLCNLVAQYNIENLILYAVMLLLIMLISLINTIVFIMPKMFIIFNFNVTESSIRVINNSTSE
ncbi:hypothetical protein LY90DRAFT_666761 [Neocallimastix californiae]|uniref:G-protein coupled receptors family 3 profile domain-containing protein n=1 Tax=Neocallimastix californiae TaxID=1754190 RepID=A0A1Y2ENN1_9FUNG|nr:hypothetical protein LY90DRAFT_666761 [Neocallimastix californiae]|eukprot:ORY73158.1 hypothetical protein LY90DRAFT_666761 [Neocallimastix californiae]